MRKQTLVAGLILIFLGIVFLGANLFGFLLGFRLWQFWPLVVIGAGLLFVLPPLLVRGKRGLGALFIPGVPILTTGSILLLASVFRWWHVWSWLWPLEVIGVSLGFTFAAFYMRVPWLLIPAVIVGANGLLLQFCAWTGWWGVWSVMWTIEPLAVGLSLLAVILVRQLYGERSARGLWLAALIICALAGLGFVQSVLIVGVGTFLPWWEVWRWSGALLLILAGTGLLLAGMLGHTSPARSGEF